MKFIGNKRTLVKLTNTVKVEIGKSVKFGALAIKENELLGAQLAPGYDNFETSFELLEKYDNLPVFLVIPEDSDSEVSGCTLTNGSLSSGKIHSKTLAASFNLAKNTKSFECTIIDFGESEEVEGGKIIGLEIDITSILVVEEENEPQTEKQPEDLKSKSKKEEKEIVLN